jgi:hypothetical protein
VPPRACCAKTSEADTRTSPKPLCAVELSLSLFVRCPRWRGAQAAAALANLARESEDNRKSIVDANGIAPLLELLDSTSSKAKENAVVAITQLCRGSKENQAAIAKVGGIPKLVGVLLGFSTANKDTAVHNLCTLASSAIKEMVKGNRRNQDAVLEAGGIPPLVAMLQAPTPQMQANAAGALANLARGPHAENQGASAPPHGHNADAAACCCV